MDKCLNDIKFIKRENFGFYIHDPFYNQYKNPKENYDRAYMDCARPIQNVIKKWDSVTDMFEIISIEESESYYRPSEIYDHYYSPNELDNMTIKQQINLQKCLSYNNYYNFNHLICILSLMINENVSFIHAIQRYIYITNFRIVRSMPLPQKFLMKQYSFFENNYFFDETWWTINYLYLLIPRVQNIFVNPRDCHCTCYTFKKNSICIHSLYYSIRRLFNNFLNTQLSIDLSPIVLEYLSSN